jgi:hypothetical protein
MIDGCSSLATANKALTIFSPSPNHLDVSVEALILKNLEFDSAATALA